MSDEPVLIVSYDPDWPRRFAEEQEALRAAIAAWVPGGIHHVGSTAVPGLDAKPVIDILAGVRDHLRSSPGDAAAYAKLKRELAERYGDDREAYTAAKSEYVRGVLDGN